MKNKLEKDPENKFYLSKIAKIEKDINVNLDPKLIIKQKENLARYLKAKIEKTYLGDICLFIEEV